MKIDAKRCAERLMEMDDIRLLCHRDPDGDTYGSAMALFDALTRMGKRVKVECVHPFPKNLAFLKKEMPADFEEKFNVAIDIAAPSMLGDPPESRPHVHLCIDHHPTNPLYADETLLVDYGSAGEAVFEVIKELGADFTPYCATALFTAISSDTGGLRYSSVTPLTMRKSAELMDCGADFNLVRVSLFESKSRGQIQVESTALSQARYYSEGRIAVISVTLDMLAKAGIDESELEGLASKPIEIDGVDIGITLKERTDGSIRVSMRSTENADCSVICKEFEGGGHVRASGCRIWDSIENAEKKLIEACLRHFE